MTRLHVVAEHVEVVRRAKFLRYGFPPPWLEFLVQESLRPDEPPPCRLPCPDPGDAPFLALASAAGAWLVRGNLRHVPPAARGGVRVVSPGAYLDHLRASGVAAR